MAKKNRVIELFEGDNRLLSMARLTVFLSFWPATWALYAIRTEGALSIYLGAYVINYGLNKATEGYKAKVAHQEEHKP